MSRDAHLQEFIANCQVGAAIDSFGTTIPLDPQTGQEIYTPATLTATINSIKVELSYQSLY